MSADEFGEKTEQPTDHRRQEERRRGNVAHSSELNIAGHLVAAAAVLAILGGGLIESLGRFVATRLSNAADQGGDRESIQISFMEVAEWAGEHVLPLFGALFVAALAVNFAQVGFLLATEKITPNIKAINPASGLKRIFSIRSVVTLAISLGKLTLLGSAAAWIVWSELPLFLSLTTAPVAASALALGSAIVKLAVLLASILVVIGLLDFGFQKWKHEQEIMMTKEETKREMKEMEGDPMIRRRRRDAHHKLAEARDIGKVSSSTFMVTNPTHYAIAFRYEYPEYPVPTVVAKGMDEVALRMREVATEHGIPIIERPELARQVYRQLAVGQSIPADLYEVFIEILKYVYTITGQSIDLSGVDEVAA